MPVSRRHIKICIKSYLSWWRGERSENSRESIGNGGGTRTLERTVHEHSVETRERQCLSLDLELRSRGPRVEEADRTFAARGLYTRRGDDPIFCVNKQKGTDIARQIFARRSRHARRPLRPTGAGVALRNVARSPRPTSFHCPVPAQSKLSFGCGRGKKDYQTQRIP